MLATPIILLALATSAKLATSLRIPEGTLDGVYSVYINESGVEVHEPLFPGDVPAPTNSEEPEVDQLEARDITTVSYWCGCGITMNHGDCDAAVQALKNQFGSGQADIGAHLAWYSISGSVVAFACNREGGKAAGSAAKITGALQGITNKCGWYVPGTQHLYTGLFYTPYFGYMNYRPGLDFCTMSVSSGSHKC
ncbi:uncharacterized protein CDV56_107041 [Aspergillus thermomutatus]|uniref:Ecp2 effector protein domain-containing protein n=1 Tax=Aspergillus thermomutatus TaxID=41047 RepID=A0A397GNK6_ASPTH|nr:uncharacterized protein CDV56_107041 [Aspergillus thermomutatus]RHZ52632.1 hypothetical protein CDV56_107041 [Aspergillus thermomutatus]